MCTGVRWLYSTVDVGIRAKLMTEAELERTIQLLEQNIQDIAKAGI